MKNVFNLFFIRLQNYFVLLRYTKTKTEMGRARESNWRQQFPESRYSVYDGSDNLHTRANMKDSHLYNCIQTYKWRRENYLYTQEFMQRHVQVYANTTWEKKIGKDRMLWREEKTLVSRDIPQVFSIHIQSQLLITPNYSESFSQ